MKQEIITYLSTLNNDIFNLSKYLYDNPEESFKEFKSCTYITNLLRQNGFKVTENYIDIKTSFYAEFGSGYPKICYICEYDALKDHGHITGHNLITSISVAAALGLSKVVSKIGGTVIILGCPGEFKDGSKVTMVKQGTFKDIDLVLMAHPDTVTAESGTSMALLPLKINYKSSEGFSYRNKNSYTALDSCLFTFNALNILSKGFHKDCYINSVINNAGSSPSLMPKESEAKIYIRAKNMCIAESAECKIRELVKFTGSLMDISSSVSMYELPCDNLITNRTLSRIFSHNLKESGIIDVGDPIDTSSGLSLGTVSHVVPCIHPYISIVENNEIKYSTREFADATISNFATERVMKIAQALAATAVDVIEKETLMSSIKNEHFNSIEKSKKI